MKFAYTLVAVAALGASAAAYAEDPTPPAAPVPAAAAPVAAGKPARDPNRVICKSEEETGSRIAAKKVCLTAAAWKDRAFNAGQWADRQTTMNSPVNGGR